jgi:hypothetical protein
MNSSSVVLIASVLIIAGFAIVTSALLQPKSESFSQILTFGPLWNNGNNWTCTSDASYLVHGALRGLLNSQIAISMPSMGSQSLYQLDAEHLQSFTVGGQAGHSVIITKTGTVTGWITLQTMSGAKANCTQT